MRLLGKRLLVRPIPAKPISPGGIHLVDTYNSHQKLWRVIDTGPGIEDIQKGDSVFLPDYGYRPDIGDGTRIIDLKEAIAVIRES